jgi:N-acetylglucosamine-6-sulfatase
LDRRTFLVTSAAAGLAAQTRTSSGRKPNFVFIVSDDHHWQTLGISGNPHVRTPNIDRLAKRGVYFVNGNITTPQCAPSRGVLLTGLETYQNGLKSNGATRFNPDIGPTVMEQLRLAGYDTTLIGKWHSGHTPAECGFAKAPLWLRGGSSNYMDPVLVRGIDGAPGKQQGHITYLFTDEAVKYLESARQPFFLWLAYNAPHSPLHASTKFSGAYAGKTETDLYPPAHPKDAKPIKWSTYYAVINELDDQIGRVIAQIEKSGQWDNTVIVFLGDNGMMCGTKNIAAKVVPWEESVRVPFMAAGGPVKAGIRHEDPVASIDLPATWMDFAGLKPARPLAGRSLKALLTTGKGGPAEAFATWDDGRAEALAVKQAVEPYREIRTRKYKLIVWESKKLGFYDLAADPVETRNLADDPVHQAALKDLRGRLTARMKATGDHAISWLGGDAAR